MWRRESYLILGHTRLAENLGYLCATALTCVSGQ